jgi:hypothetical protein
MVNTPVPTMLPITRPVADVRPKAWAFSLFRPDMGGPVGVDPAASDSVLMIVIGLSIPMSRRT